MFEKSILTIPFYLEILILRNHFFERIGFLLESLLINGPIHSLTFVSGIHVVICRYILRVHPELWGCLIGYFEKFVRCFPITGSGCYFKFAFH